jgi:hypothetical protein
MVSLRMKRGKILYCVTALLLIPKMRCLNDSGSLALKVATIWLRRQVYRKLQGFRPRSSDLKG